MARVPQDTENRISYKFRARLITIIAERDMSKETFAAAAHVNKEIITRATVYGIVPSIRSLIKIADFLNCSIPYLLGETDDNSFDAAKAPSDFHSRLEELKREREVRDCDILKAMSCPANSFAEWRRNKSIPSLQYLQQIATFFKVTIDYLLGRTDFRI